jgi:tetratricopeptide (TPR) repeat protein
MRSLMRKSFLTRDQGPGGTSGAGGRYQIHELLRQYGQDKLRELPGGQERALNAHCRYYARYYADRAWEIWSRGLGEAAPELENLLVAWRWAARSRNRPALRAFLGRELGGIHQVYVSLSMFAQGTADFERAVAALRTCEPTPENELALALALRQLAMCASYWGERYHHAGARRALRESIAILERLGVEDELALSHICASAIFNYDPDALRQSLARCRRTGNLCGVIWACALLGAGALNRGAYDDAEAYLQESLDLSRAWGHVRSAAWPIRFLGSLARVKGEHARAKALYEESLAAFRAIGAFGYANYDLNCLAEVALEMGNWAEARLRFEEALSSAQDLGDRTTMAIAISGLGDVARAEGDEEGAEAYYQRALAVSRVPNVDLRPHILLRQARQVAAGGDAALAVELATMALHRPLTDDETRAGAQSLLDELESELDPAAYADAVAVGLAQAPYRMQASEA